MANMNNRNSSLSDYIAGMGAAAERAARLGSESSSLGNAAYGLAARTVNKFTRTKGASYVGSAIDTIAPILQKAYGTPFYQMLSEAAERGNAAVGSAHYLLMQMDPNYQEMWNKEQ